MPETSPKRNRNDDQHKLLDCILQCSLIDIHIFNIILCVNHAITLYIAKKMKGNGPVTVDIASSSS